MDILEMSDLNLSFLQSLTRRSWFSFSTRNIQCLEATKNSRVLTMLPVSVLVHLRILHHMQFHFSLPFVQTFCGICHWSPVMTFRWRFRHVAAYCIPRISILPLSCPSDGPIAITPFCLCLMSGVEQSVCGHGLWWKRKSPQNSMISSQCWCVLGGSLSI